jgi:hypothetical protein
MATILNPNCVLGVLALTGCMGIASPPDEKLPKGQAIKVTKTMEFAAKPLTVELPLDAAHREELTAAMADDARTIRVTFRKVVPPKETNVTGFTAFLNLKDATSATPADDPHYIGSAAFFPRKVTPSEGGNFVFNAKTAIQKTKFDLASAKSISVTLVATTESMPPAESSIITVGEIELQVFDVKK